ncbi:MAG: HEAT repeat domain-containing protein [Caldilineaceae bacterium]
MNKHQKAAFRTGEHRVRLEDIEYYLTLAASDDADERLEAASNLCPCHVRKPIDQVQTAIFRMMEDPDVRVRQAAWHTLEDGGVPDDPRLDPIFERAVANETNPTIRHFVAEFAEPRLREKQIVEQKRGERASSLFSQRGKCDFCGESNVPVKPDYETEIGAHAATRRLALICEPCHAGQVV